MKVDNVLRYVRYLKKSHERPNGFGLPTTKVRVEYSHGVRWVKVYLAGKKSKEIIAFIDRVDGNVYEPLSLTQRGKIVDNVNNERSKG